MNKHDLNFMKHFAQLIVGLMVLTVVLILGAHYIYGQQPREENQVLVAATNARIAPVGAVFAGETGKAAMAAAKAAAAEASKGVVAYDGTLDGATIYNNLCGACHTSGAGGAPKLEQAAWAARTAQGMDTVVKHAIEGYTGSAGVMPARGGNPALSDDQVRATVQWMVDNLK
ncbi:MAG TPA: c-type cytochrome [Patescibacteria group bacterium]|nr:c-type cytochrome [Patescibacteria group bacterium]